MMYDLRCKHCAAPLSYDEAEFGDVCDRCGEILFERALRKREWEHFHPGESCPEEELPQKPGT